MAQNVVEGGWRNKLAYMGLHDLQMPIIHTWNVSLNMWNYHTNYRCPGTFDLLCSAAAYCMPNVCWRLVIGSVPSWQRVAEATTKRLCL